MKRWQALPLVALALILGVSVPAYSQQAASVDQQIARGQAAFDQGDYTHALLLWQPAVTQLREIGNKKALAYLLYEVGVANERLNNYDKVLEPFQEAVAIDREIKDRSGEADILGEIGAVEIRHLNRYEDALVPVQQAVAIDRELKNRLGEANNLLDIGVIEANLSRYDDALSWYRQALAIYRDLKNRLGQARALNNIGLLEGSLGRFDDGMGSLQQALAIDRDLKNRALESSALGNIASVEGLLDRYDDALSLLQQALAIAREIKDRLGEAGDLNTIGSVELELGRYDDALSSYQQALAIARELKNRAEEGNNLSNIGEIARDHGRYDDALNSLQDALAIARELKNRAGEADALGSIGSVEIDLGRYDDALTSLQRALAIQRDIKNLFSEARDLNNIGTVEMNLGRYEDALNSLEQALAIARNNKNRSGEALTLNNIGLVEMSLGRYDDALNSLQQALAIAHDIKNRSQEATELIGIGSVETNLGRNNDALSFAHEAERLGRELLAPEVSWRARHIAAFAEAHLDHRNAALADYDAAVTQIESLRAGLNQRERSSFFPDKLHVYDEYIGYLLQLDRRFPGKGYDREGLEIFEREQARAFLEEIGQSSARHFKGVPENVTMQQALLADREDRTQASLLKALTALQPDAGAVSTLEQQLASIQRQHTALESLIRTRYPAYYRLLHPHPVQPQALQALLHPSEALFVYDAMDKQTALWMIDSQRIQLLQLPGDVAAKVTALSQGPKQIQDAIDKPYGKESVSQRQDDIAHVVQSNLPQFAEQSYALYNELFPPVAQAVAARAKQLLIVPTGALYKLPWEALVTKPPASGDIRYLLQDHTVSYLSSASLLQVLRVAHRSARYPIVAFANPTFGTSSPTVSGAAQPDHNQTSSAQMHMQTLAGYVSQGVVTFPSLPGTDDEAKNIIAELKAPAESQPLYHGDAASRGNVLALNSANCISAACLADYRYVLFATHAVLPDAVQGFLQPSLVLAHPERGDGYLTMGDAFGLSLNADIVALSACNTGQGIATHGDGVRGLTQAFMFAGTPVVSVTLWETIDSVNKVLMPSLFAGLSGGKVTPSYALREAKLQFLSDPLLKHPFFWAPTILFGDADSLPIK